jgi:3-dehydroquinate synthase
VIVRHRHGDYKIEETDLATSLAPLEGCYVLTDKNVHAHWQHLVVDKPCYVIEPGERSKTLPIFGDCLEWLAEGGASRSSTVIAFGGGVVGDLAGFVAATYMRGIKLIQAPTSLLAMVDSSVGGKVGLDLDQGKNLVGAFYPPMSVLIDYKLLATLPNRELINGAAEIWKYGAILDEHLLAMLEERPIGPGDDRLPQLVMHCVELKRLVVEADELETAGTRAVLNFGHTVGHAIEKATGYGPVLHGEAISVGMVVEALIGEKVGVSPKNASDRLRMGLRSQGLPTEIPGCDPADLLKSMRLDKKAFKGRLALALLTGYGSCKLVHDVPEPVVLECLRENL